MLNNIVLPISIIIPAYSEEVWLPILLRSIRRQIAQPLEVIVADANSPDKTREIAQSYGAIIVKGGKVAVGRNAGAKIAKGDYLLFMDADTELPDKNALLEAFMKMKEKDIDIASAKYVVKKDGVETNFGKFTGSILWSIANIWRSFQNLTGRVSFEGGAFIFVKKTVYEKLCGFDENLTVNEDPDFYKRAIKAGYKYCNLDVKIATSVRRFDSPYKVSKYLKYFLINTALIGVGLYAGSKLVKNNMKRNYGNMGGGEGIQPK